MGNRQQKSSVNNNNNVSTLFKKIPRDIVHTEIIPHIARDWLRVSREYNKIASYHLLFDARIDPATHDNVAIGWAAEHGHETLVRRLLADTRVNPAAKSNHALRVAAFFGHANIVVLLLADSRVNPILGDYTKNASEWTSDYLACTEFSMEDFWDFLGITRDWSKNFAKCWATAKCINCGEHFAIRMAACLGHVNVVAALLGDERVNPAAYDNQAIQWAFENGHAKVVALLLTDPRVAVDVRIRAWLRTYPKIALQCQ